MTRLTSSLGLVVFAATTIYAQSNPKPVNWKELPPPFHTAPVKVMGNMPVVIPKPDGATLQVPPGFVVEEYMSGFVRPRLMVLGPQNEIILSDTGISRDTGAVYVLKDGTKTAILEKLDRPYGMALHQGWLYVAETGSVKRYPYDAKTMRVHGAAQEIIPLRDFRSGHWTRSILFNDDYSKLYVSIGSQSNASLGEPAMRAALHRYNVDGSGHEIVATGLRNVVGIGWYPGTKDLWVSVQERDELGDEVPPDFVTKIREGAFYGWPIAYIGPHQDPRHKDVDQAMLKSTAYPDVLLGGHVGVLDMMFYTGTQFPEKYRGGMFLAFHGSQGRIERTGYKVAFIPFRNRKPTSGPEDFLTGWMLGADKKEVWGRPTGLMQLPDGSLLVSDDGASKIYRVSYKRQPTGQR